MSDQQKAAFSVLDLASRKDIDEGPAPALHFAPRMMTQAIDLYRRHFQPSAVLDKPYVMLGVPLVAADTDAQAEFLANGVNMRRAASTWVAKEAILSDAGGINEIVFGIPDNGRRSQANLEAFEATFKELSWSYNDE